MNLAELLDSTADGVCAVAPDGKIVYWNRAAEKILGYPAREVLGRPCCDIFVGRDASGNRLCCPECHVLRLVRMNEPMQHFDMATRDRSGRPVWLNMSILVASNGRAAVRTTIHLFRDVTASREMEALLRERMAQSAAAPATSPGPSASLTRRENEILALIKSGADTKAMAARLNVSPQTVRNHVQSILGRLGVHSRLEAVAYVTTHGLFAQAVPKRWTETVLGTASGSPSRNVPHA